MEGLTLGNLATLKTKKSVNFKLLTTESNTHKNRMNENRTVFLYYIQFYKETFERKKLLNSIYISKTMTKKNVKPVIVYSL